MKNLVLFAFAIIGPGLSTASPVMKDQFLREASVGNLAIASELVPEISAAKKVQPLSRNTTTSFKRRKACVVAIAHKSGENAHKITFVGVQLLKFFNVHATPGVIHLIRNEGWSEHSTLKQLGASKFELSSQRMADFSSAHETPEKLRSLGSTDVKQNAADSWHARLESSTGSSYSADPEYIKFWRTDPTADPLLRSAHPEALQGSKPMRVENRLIKFALTNGGADRIPSFKFDCSDPALILAAIKVYVPSESEAFWTYLKFE